VIFTGSLGVLKSGDIEFLPKLPEDKLKKIDDANFVKYIKICLAFPENFWGDKEFIGFLTEDISQDYPMALNLDYKNYLPGS
jgi:hypothetical protein